MAMKDWPIGVYDSGVGGLSVLKVARRLLPHEDFFYFGDSQNAPYGEKTREQLLTISDRAVSMFEARPVKALVVACNTVSCQTLDELKQRHPALPMIGTRPAVDLALAQDPEALTLVMATPLTIASAPMQAAFLTSDKLIPLPCPGLVDLLEKDSMDAGALTSLLHKLFAPHLSKDIRQIVLGCTHYPFASKEILSFFPSAQLIDNAARQVKSLMTLLDEKGLRNENAGAGELTLTTSGGESDRARMHALFEA